MGVERKFWNFQDKIKKDRDEMEELDKNKNLERLAREKYLMKRKNEDIYIIKEDSI
jgi:cell division protein FtsB